MMYRTLDDESGSADGKEEWCFVLIRTTPNFPGEEKYRYQMVLRNEQSIKMLASVQNGHLFELLEPEDIEEGSIHRLRAC